MSPLDQSRRVLDLLVQAGAGFVAHAPGARDLPLLAALRERPELERVDCLDERAAGYLALGWIRGRALSGETTGLPPALVVCTSGGAALNLLPAAAEATESGLPLILLTADRPQAEIGRGANQTIDQFGPFTPLVRAQLRLDPERPGWAEELGRALADLRRQPGALQLNLAFREPLLAAGADPPIVPLPPLSQSPIEQDSLPEFLDERWAAGPARARRGLVWVCDLPRLADRQAARELAKRLGWPLLADGGSGLWGQQPGGPLILRQGEDLLPQLADCDFVLQLGKRPVSRRLLEALHQRPGVLVDDHPGVQDPLGLGRERWRCRPAGLLEALERGSWPRSTANPDWSAELAAAQRRAACRRSAVLHAPPRLSEAEVVRHLLAQLPADCGLFAGNSLPVRLLDQWLGGLEHDVKVAGNRGLSGIDGQLACAQGFQRGLGRPAAALLGDLSLLHDLSSLALLARERTPLLVLVLHNDGGGIFRLHPDSADHPWAWSSHGLRLMEPARALGLEAARPADPEQLDLALEGWRERPRPLLLELRVACADHGRRTRRLAEAPIPAAPAGPARRIWLHGFLGAPADWDEVRARLGPAPGAECLPTLPGHGTRPAPVPERLEGWLEALLEELGGDDPLELIGYSLGARLALRLALRLPGRVRRLALLGAGVGLSGTQERTRRAHLDDERASQLRRQGLAPFLHDWYAQPLFATLRARPRFAEWRARREQGDAAALARALEVASPGRQPNLWPRLGELALPVLWLAGEHDTPYAALLERAAARCPDGRAARVPGAGHPAQLEEPAALARLLDDFLAPDLEHTT